MSCHHTRVSIDLEMDLSRITIVVALQVFKDRCALGPSSIQIDLNACPNEHVPFYLLDNPWAPTSSWTMNVFQLHEAAVQSQLSNLSSIVH